MHRDPCGRHGGTHRTGGRGVRLPCQRRDSPLGRTRLSPGKPQRQGIRYRGGIS